MTEPVHVVPGWGPTTWATIGTAVIAFFGFLGVWVRQRVPFRRNEIAAEERMREELTERLKESEARREDDKAQFEKRMKEAENEMRIMRHRLNNATHTLDMLIALLEANPDKVRETLVKVSEIRSQQLEAEALEKGQVMAAREARA